MIEQLRRQPRNSIPSAISGWSETRSAYNLLAHEQVTARKVLAPHYQSTLERIEQHPVALVAQDTTELDDTGKNDVEGLGTLNYENRRGLSLHATLAITPEPLSLEQLDSWSWSRPLEDADKESIRWIEGYQRTSEAQQQLHDAGAPTRDTPVDRRDRPHGGKLRRLPQPQERRFPGASNDLDRSATMPGFCPGHRGPECN